MAALKGCFFYAMNTIPYYNKDILSLNTEKPSKPKVYQAPEFRLSDNIQQFDKKVAQHTSPTPQIQEVSDIEPTPTAGQMLTDPLYNSVGKLLGVDTLREWGTYYDKVYEIVLLAKEKSGIKDLSKLPAWIYQQLNNAPSLGNRKITDVYTYLKMGNQPKPRAKAVVKPVIKKVSKPKETTEQFANRWIGEQFNGS